MARARREAYVSLDLVYVCRTVTEKYAVTTVVEIFVDRVTQRRRALVVLVYVFRPVQARSVVRMGAAEPAGVVHLRKRAKPDNVVVWPIVPQKNAASMDVVAVAAYVPQACRVWTDSVPKCVRRLAKGRFVATTAVEVFAAGARHRSNVSTGNVYVFLNVKVLNVVPMGVVPSVANVERD